MRFGLRLSDRAYLLWRQRLAARPEGTPAVMGDVDVRGQHVTVAQRCHAQAEVVFLAVTRPERTLVERSAGPQAIVTHVQAEAYADRQWHLHSGKQPLQECGPVRHGA